MPGWRSVGLFGGGCLTGLVVPVLLLFLAALFLQEQVAALRTGQLGPPPVPSGVRVPYDWQVETLDGEAVPATEWAGQPVFLTFWNPTCLSCLAQLPRVNALYETLADRDIAFAAVSVVDDPTLPQLVLERDLYLPVYTLDGWPPPAMGIDEQAKMPTTLVLDHTGAIRLRVTGAFDWGHPKAVAFLDRLALEAAATLPEAEGEG